MTALSLGPLVLPADRLAALVAILVFLVAAELAGARSGRRRAIADWAFAGLLAGLVAARAGFVIAHWQSYRASPLDILALWQGGFSPRAGVLGLGAMILLSVLREARVARPLVLAAVAGGLVWSAAQFALDAETRGRLPEARFADLAGGEVAPALRLGQPLVLNLWASWCPPCRREMPMMTDLAAGTTGIDMLFANQGEDADQVRAFLARSGLPRSGMILDPGQRLMAEFAIDGLPATLFFDAEGRLQSVHIGEISRARLSATMNELKESAL